MTPTHSDLAKAVLAEVNYWDAVSLKEPWRNLELVIGKLKYEGIGGRYCDFHDAAKVIMEMAGQITELERQVRWYTE